MKGIYAYTDYRLLIHDYLEFKKKQGLKISLRYLSTKASLGAANYLSLVLEGKRKLTISGALSLGNFMGFQTHEIKYFVGMVELSRADTNNEIKYYEERLLELKRNKPHNTKKLGANTLSTDWRYPILLMLLIESTLEESIRKVVKVFNVTEKQASDLLSSFLKQGMLSVKDGKFLVNDSYSSHRDSKSSSMATANFLATHSEVLAKSLKKKYSSESKHIVQVLGSKKIRKAEFFAILEEASQSCAALVNDDPVEEIFILHYHCQTLSNYL